MTVQLRRTSLIEAATQASIGLPLGFAVSYAVSMLCLPPSVSAMLITALMFALSVARGYLIRRKFEEVARTEEWLRETLKQGMPNE